jgi:hypothetical protein
MLRPRASLLRCGRLIAAKRPLTHHVHLPPPSRLLLSTSSPSNSNNNHQATSSAREEHERRVTAAQALVLEQQQERRRRQPSKTTHLPPKTSDLPATPFDDSSSSTAEDASNHLAALTITANTVSKTGDGLSPMHLHTIANSIQHWCSKDPTFFDATMEALNLSALSKQSNAPSQQPNQHPLHVLVNQYRQLYYESIADFRTHVVDTEPPSLQVILKQLVEAGFGDPTWSKRYRQVRGYKSRQQQMERMLVKQNSELERRRQVVQLAEKELVGLLFAAQKSAVVQKRLALKDQRLMDNILHQRTTRESSSSSSSLPSLVSEAESSSFWSKVASWFSSSSPEPEPETDLSPRVSSTDDNDDDVDTDQPIFFDPFAPPAHRQRKRLRAKLKAIQFLQRDVQETEREVTTLESNRETLRFPLPLHEYERARAAIQNAREIVCQELAQFIGERHTQLIEQYQRLDKKTDLTKPHEWFSYARLDRRKVCSICGACASMYLLCTRLTIINTLPPFLSFPDYLS